VVSVDDGDAILMAQKLAESLGLGVGISSGANLVGAIMVHETLGPDAVVVTVFPDDNKKYLSTDLLRREPVKPDLLCPHVDLLGFAAFKRVCHTCCDPVDCVEAWGDGDRGQELPQLPPCPRRTEEPPTGNPPLR